MSSADLEALLADLAGSVGPGGLTTDPSDLSPWTTDWRGVFHGHAIALVSPSSTSEVQSVVGRCAGAGVSIVPQGGNTSMVGGATPNQGGRSILLSLRRMRHIRSISTADSVAVAEAGVILSDLHTAADRGGLRFPLSTAAKGSATIGGLVSTNAGGTQVMRHGTMRALTVGIEAVLPNGTLVSRLNALRKDTRGLDLGQLFIGTEGTLGVVTAAALRLVPAIRSRVVIWAGFADPAAALECLRALEQQFGPIVESFELVPLEGVELVTRYIAGTRSPLATNAPWQVLIEVSFEDESIERRERIAEFVGRKCETGAVIDAVIASSEAQAEALWKVREALSEAERLEGKSLKHDIAVAVSAMPAFVISARARIEAMFSGARVLAFGHLGDGNIHLNVRPPATRNGAAWLEERADEISRVVYEMITAEGGTISGEHGIGQLKLRALEDHLPATELRLLRLVKKAIDPTGLMNPGKILRH